MPTAVRQAVEEDGGMPEYMLKGAIQAMRVLSCVLFTGFCH